MQIEKPVLYVIFPYLRTDPPVWIRKIPIWPHSFLDDNPDLTDEDKHHLKILFPIFYLQNDIRPNNMAYTLLHLNSDINKTNKLLKNLNEIRVLLAYLFGSPNFPIGGKGMEYEYFDIYIIQTKDDVIPSLVGISRDQVDDMQSESPDALFKTLHGYEGIINFQTMFWAVKGSRLYPPYPNARQYYSQDFRFRWMKKPGYADA